MKRRDKEIKDQDEIDYENHIMEYDDQYLDNSNDHMSLPHVKS